MADQLGKLKKLINDIKKGVDSQLKKIQKESVEEQFRSTCYYLERSLKAATSIPATRNSKGGYTKAIYGAPPRRVTGALTNSIKVVVDGLTFEVHVSATSRSGFDYPGYHETYDPRYPMSGRHPFIRPLISYYRPIFHEIIQNYLRRGGTL